MILVDTHVHVHPCFNLEAFFDAALKHMSSMDIAPDPTDRVLCLTEANGAHVFRDWATEPGPSIAGPWKVCDAPDPFTLRIAGHAEASFWVVAGRQIVSSERLEILCLGRDADLPDRTMSLADLTARIIDTGGLPVLPWGFGKWTGERGSAVAAFLEQAAIPDTFCLGDNGNRPRVGPEPDAFRMARSKNIPVLPGSDPLPLASTCTDVGRYGLRMDGHLPDAAVWDHLLTRLARPDISCIPYGQRESLPRFVWNQTRLRLPH